MSLHWLRVAYRIQFTILTLTYRVLQASAFFFSIFMTAYITHIRLDEDCNTFIPWDVISISGIDKKKNVFM